MHARTRTAVDLDRRRGWARGAAVVACLAGTLVFGLSCAGMAVDELRQRAAAAYRSAGADLPAGLA